jgi:hypothetical protein
MIKAKSSSKTLKLPFRLTPKYSPQVDSTMDHFKFEYEVCMDSVTMKQNLETDETKFFLGCSWHLCIPTAGFGWFALLHLTHDERVPFE